VSNRDFALLKFPPCDPERDLDTHLADDYAREQLCSKDPGRSRSALCGLTFELKPTTEVGTVSLDCEDAGWPQARLTVPAVVGRRLERGVRHHVTRAM
jgi:hypothetical protein